jgi:hypothetical protein
MNAKTPNLGWQCPVCSTVWAPTVQKCVQCSPAAVPCEPLYPPTGEPPYWVYPTRWVPIAPPMWGPIIVTCTSTTSPKGETYTLYNDPGVSVFAQ